MSPESTTLALLVAQSIGLLALSAWFTAAETAVRSLNRNHLKLLADAGNAAAGRVRRLQEDAEGLNGLGLVWRYLALVLLSQWLTLATLQWLGASALGWTSLLLTALAVPLGAVLPRAYAEQQPDAFRDAMVWMQTGRVLQDSMLMRCCHTPQARLISEPMHISEGDWASAQQDGLHRDGVRD